MYGMFKDWSCEKDEDLIILQITLKVHNTLYLSSECCTYFMQLFRWIKPQAWTTVTGSLKCIYILNITVSKGGSLQISYNGSLWNVLIWQT